MWFKETILALTSIKWLTWMNSIFPSFTKADCWVLVLTGNSFDCNLLIALQHTGCLDATVLIRVFVPNGLVSHPDTSRQAEILCPQSLCPEVGNFSPRHSLKSVLYSWSQTLSSFTCTTVNEDHQVHHPNMAFFSSQKWDGSAMACGEAGLLIRRMNHIHQFSILNRLENLDINKFQKAGPD